MNEKKLQSERLEEVPSERRTGFFFVVLVVLLLYCVLFAEPHMGATNNGDYYRFAERCAINGIELFEGDEYPFFYKVYEKWQWKPMDFQLLTPVKQSFGNVWLVSLVRLVTNIFDDTAQTPFSTFSLSIVYAVLFLCAAAMLIWAAVRLTGQRAQWMILIGIVMLMGSMHLAWFNSLYGEAMLYVGLLLSCGLLLFLILEKHSVVCTLLSYAALCVSIFLFLTAKPQGVLAWPFWSTMLVVLVYNLCKAIQSKHRWLLKGTLILITAGFLVYSGISCVSLYKWNGEYNERDTLYSSIMYGALMLTDTQEEAEAMLTDMGLPTECYADKGRHAYSSPDEFHTQEHIEEMKDLLCEKTNTFGVLKYYLSHPVYSYRALEITASYAVQPAVSLLMFNGQDISQGAVVQERFALWQRLRPYVVPHHFLTYVVVYAALFLICIHSLVRHRKDMRHCMLIGMYLLIMATGIIQYPLPFIGNGLADTNKQLYLFMLCWDITILIAVGWGVNRCVDILRQRQLKEG